MTKLLYIPNGTYVSFPDTSVNTFPQRRTIEYEKSFLYARHYKNIADFIKHYCTTDLWECEIGFNEFNHIDSCPLVTEFEVCF